VSFSVVEEREKAKNMKCAIIFQIDYRPGYIQGVLKRYVKNLKRYSSHLKDEKMLYGHRCGNAYFKSYVENILLAVLLTQGKI